MKIIKKNQPDSEEKASQVFLKSNITNFLVIVVWLTTNTAHSIGNATLEIGAISNEQAGWKLEGVKLNLTGMQQQSQLRLSATKMELPKPFTGLSLANIQCNHFTWNHDEVLCKNGKASVKSTDWQSLKTDFSFHLNPQKAVFRLKNAEFAGSRLALKLEATGNHWRVKIDGLEVSHQLVDALIQGKAVNLKKVKSKPATQGDFTVTGTVSGYRNNVQDFDLTVGVDQLTDQAADGKVASEKSHLHSHVVGKNINGNRWAWHSETKMLGGALYVDPVYIEAGVQPIVLNSKGIWNGETKRADIQSFTYQHPDHGEATGSAALYYRNGVKIDKVDVNVNSDTLQGLMTAYINPFFTESPFTGMTIVGDVKGRFLFNGTSLADSSIRFSKLNVQDEVGRLQVNDGAGLINWSDDPFEKKQSEVSWQKLAIKGLPIKASRLLFNSQGRTISLTQKVKLPVFNGTIAIDMFSWQGKVQDEPDVIFAGSINDISLEQLSRKMGWTPLSGNISGLIPGIAYHGKKLSLDGELLVNAFDGAIKVKNLTAAGLFSSLPQVTADIEVANLDLDKLTRKFEFGSISGRLSGNVNKIVLENWRPVAFFAWLGTPDDDESRHRISQKAVNNIASIGGGGASDVLSRSFLGFFETFGYDKIGVGCYLHKGVCQMMGLEATGQGYYLIKGGGLPRIDVLGYNTQVNWDVLVERLGRVATPNNAIIE